MGYLSKRKFQERERSTTLFLLMAIPTLTLLGTLGRSADWRLDYIGEFKTQAAFLSMALCVWCVVKKRWMESAVFVLFAVLNLALVASHYHLSEQESRLPEDSYRFTFLYQDLKGADEHDDDVRRVLDSTDADLVLWTNVPVEIYRKLNEIKGAYYLQNQSFNKQGKMMLILARTPGTARGLVDDDAGIWVSRVIGTRKLTLALTSLGDPWSRKSYKTASDKIAALSNFVRSRDEPVVLIGGFGASGWSYLLKPLEDVGGLQTDSTVVLTAGANRPWFLRRPSDYVYVHPGMEVADLRATEPFGTNHVGLTGTLKIAPIRKEIEFFELEPTLPEEDLLQPPL